jgi:deoxyribonuclease-4
MKIGAKIYRYTPELENILFDVDFLEIMALRSADYSFFRNLAMPIVIHAPHEGFGINNANSSSYQENIDSMVYTLKLADYLSSDKIVVHPGSLADKACSFDTSISVVGSMEDSRIMVENMPSNVFLCSSFKDTLSYMDSSKTGLCFDINHAIETTFNSGKDYMGVLEDYLGLCPKHYHLGGQKINGKSHLSFLDSDIDLIGILRILPSDAEVSLETTSDICKTKEDIRIIRTMISYLD